MFCSQGMLHLCGSAVQGTRTPSRKCLGTFCNTLETAAGRNFNGHGHGRHALSFQNSLSCGSMYRQRYQFLLTVHCRIQLHHDCALPDGLPDPLDLSQTPSFQLPPPLSCINPRTYPTCLTAHVTEISQNWSSRLAVAHPMGTTERYTKPERYTLRPHRWRCTLLQPCRSTPARTMTVTAPSKCSDQLLHSQTRQLDDRPPQGAKNQNLEKSCTCPLISTPTPGQACGCPAEMCYGKSLSAGV